MVGLSEAAVRQRVQRLIEGGVMQVVAVTDPLELGFARQAMVGIRVTGPLEPVADALAELDEVDYVVITAGTYDLLAEVVCESDEHLLELISGQIRTHRGRRRDRDVHVPQAAQADLLVGCPLSRARPYWDRLSLWHDTAADWTRAALPGDLDVDVAVVGAGFTGLWTAYYLAEADPSLRIAVLEAETAGFGASGRNGGWCSALFPASLAVAGRAGRPRRRRWPSTRAMRRHGRRGRRGSLAAEGIDAHLAKGGTIALARSRAQLARARGRGRATPGRWGRGEDDLRLLDADEATADARGDRHRRGDVHPGLRGHPPAAAGARAGRRGRAPRRARSTSAPASARSSPAGSRTDRGDGPRRRP